jgi:hypothetical protein
VGAAQLRELVQVRRRGESLFRSFCRSGQARFAHVYPVSHLLHLTLVEIIGKSSIAG